LRAHAVGARDQHRFSPAVTVKRKQGAEPADAPKHVAGKGPPSQPADALLGLLGEGNTDASVGVSHCRKSLSAGLRGSWNPCWVFDPGGRRMTSNLANCDLAGYLYGLKCREQPLPAHQPRVRHGIEIGV